MDTSTIASKRLHILYAQSPVALVTSLIAAAVLVTLLWNVVGHIWLIVWLAVMALFTLVRQILILRFRREELPMKRVASRFRMLAVLAFLAGAVWGAGSVVFLQQAPLEYQLFIIFMAGGMVVGASASYTASTPVFNAFSLSTLIPVVSWCLMQPGRIHITIGLVLTIFAVAMWIIVNRNHMILLKSLENEHQNVSLTQKLQQEAEQRMQQKGLLKLQSQVLQTILSPGQNLESTLKTLVLEIEGHCPGMMCSVLLLDYEGKHLLHGAAPHLPEAWNSAVNGFEIGPRAGSCGTAAYRRERVIVTDITTDPLWAPYRDMALQHELHACWSQPVMDAENNVLGTFAMYYTDVRSPSEHEIHVIESAANMAAIAIEHVRKEETLHQLVEAIPDAVMMHYEGKIVYANPAAAKLFGATAIHDILGLPVLDFVHPDMQATVKKRMGKAIRKPVPLIEETLQRLDGSAFDAAVTALPVKYRGKPATEVIIHDLSARKKAEAEARRLRAAVEHAPEGIFIADGEGCIVYCNTSFAQRAGLRTEQMIGKYAAEFRGGVKGDADSRKILSSLSKRQTWEGQFTIPDTQGKSRTIIRKIAPVIETGKICYHVGIDFDLTEQHEQQAKLEHTQRLESLGVLAGGIAHDFNNILTAIMGNASLARMKLDPTAAAVQEHLHKIEVSSRRAGNLCHQMLDYAGKGKRIARPMNLTALVNEISAMLEVSLGKNVILEKNLTAALPAIKGDEAQLEQLVMNLITNANESMQSENGVITIRTGVMQADSNYLGTCFGMDMPEAGQYVFLEVSDNGCGMDAQIQQKIFDPFFTTKRTGRGLGMSALLGIVRQHHGALHLRSSKGEGTTFRILFPVMNDRAAVIEPLEDTEADPSFSGVALVVDDEEIIRETASLLMGHMGFDVITAEDGQAGVETFQKNMEDIAVVLLDMNMPRMNGEDACRKMKDLRPEIPVILASGYTETAISDRLRKEKTVTFLHKPYSQKQLKQTLHGVLTRHSRNQTGLNHKDTKSQSKA